MKNSSAGWDEIPAYVTKRCIDIYIEPLTHIIDKSFKEGISPSELKLAKVFPIFKSGDSSKITNYRPISVLSFFSKVFEKVMYNHISDLIESVNVLYKYQFGFRQRHSTQQAIITLVNKTRHLWIRVIFVIGVFLDLQKAFDTVHHKIWINCMHIASGEHMDMVSQLPMKHISVRFPMMVFSLQYNLQVVVSHRVLCLALFYLLFIWMIYVMWQNYFLLFCTRTI